MSRMPCLRFIECGDPALEKRTAIHGGLSSLRAPVKEADAERVLQAGDDFRNGGLRDAEFGGRLGHAAALHDREENLQVVEAQASAYARFRAKPGHRHSL